MGMQDDEGCMMPPKLLFMIIAAVIVAAALTVWAVTSSGAPLPLLILGALIAAGAVRLALRRKSP